MLLLSTGFTCGVIRSNDGTLTSGTRINVPDRSAGLTAGVGADLYDIYVFETELFAGSGMLMDLTEKAKAMGFGEQKYFEVPESAKQVPQVKF